MTEDSSIQLNILLSCWILSLIGVAVLETISGRVHLIIRYNRNFGCHSRISFTIYFPYIY